MNFRKCGEEEAWRSHWHILGGCLERRARLLSVVPVPGEEAVGKNWSTGVPSEAVGLPWGCSEAAWLWAWPPCSGYPCWSRSGPEGDRGPCQPQLFWDSGKGNLVMSQVPSLCLLGFSNHQLWRGNVELPVPLGIPWVHYLNYLQ